MSASHPDTTRSDDPGSAAAPDTTAPGGARIGVAAARAAAALAAGLLLYASFPPRPLWFLAPVGIAVLVLALTAGPRPPRARGGFGYGYLAGLGFLVPLLPWVGEYVGPLPWLALAAVESLFVGAFGAAAVVAARVPWAPLWIAACWSLTEWLRSSVPFGGFPWGRLAFGQPDGLLLGLASIGGAPLVSFGVALTGAGGALLARMCVRAARTRTRPGTRAAVGGVCATAAASLVALAAAPLLPAPVEQRTLTVAAIQGSVPRLGLDFNAQRKQVLDNHVARTLELAAAVRTGTAAPPDVVVWPENASDIDPLRSADAASDITRASQAVGAPILVGAVLRNADGTTTNSVIVWDGARGPQEQHDKKIIQPFGEYLPYREFFRHFSEYADRAGDFVPGDGDGVVHAAGVPIGVATCYEVAFDRAFTQSVDAGAQLLAVPTNNATFGDTEMTYQQLAMSRLRAVEHGRSLVVAATSGVSALVASDGSVLDRTALFEPAVLEHELPLYTGTTLATRLGALPEYVLSGMGVLALVAGVGVARRERSRS